MEPVLYFVLQTRLVAVVLLQNQAVGISQMVVLLYYPQWESMQLFKNMVKVRFFCSEMAIQISVEYFVVKY